MTVEEQTQEVPKVSTEYGNLAPYPRPKPSVFNGIIATPAADKIRRPPTLPAILRGIGQVARRPPKQTTTPAPSEENLISPTVTSTGTTCASASTIASEIPVRGSTVIRPAGPIVSPAIRGRVPRRPTC